MALFRQLSIARSLAKVGPGTQMAPVQELRSIAKIRPGVKMALFVTGGGAVWLRPNNKLRLEFS